MNVEIISLEATFKTVFVGGRTDMFGERRELRCSWQMFRCITRVNN